MNRIYRRLPLLGVLAAIVALAGLAAAACGDEAETSNGDVVAAIRILDSAGLHDLDEAISKDKTIPSNARTTYLQLQTVTLLTDWPDEFDAQAKALGALFGEAAAAVDGEKPDLTKAAEASKKAHDGEHDFSHELWDHLYGEAGVKTGASGHAD